MAVVAEGSVLARPAWRDRGVGKDACEYDCACEDDWQGRCNATTGAASCPCSPTPLTLRASRLSRTSS